MERLHKSSVRAVIPMACCALCAVVALFASAPKAEAARVFVAGGRAIVAAHPGFATAPAPVVVSVAPPRYVVADPVVTYRAPLLVAEESVVQTYVAPRKVVVTPTARTTTSFSLVIGGGSHYPPPHPITICRSCLTIRRRATTLRRRRRVTTLRLRRRRATMRRLGPILRRDIPVTADLADLAPADLPVVPSRFIDANAPARRFASVFLLLR